MKNEDMVAIDFETYYDSDYSLRNLPPWAYVSDSRFDAYLVAIHADDFEYCGTPEQAPWDKVRGRCWVMHNAGFDWLVIRKLQATGKVPADVLPSHVFDTADASAYHGSLRNLKDAAAAFLGVTADKTVRANMAGKNGREIMSQDSDLRRALTAYAMSDARLSFQLAKKLGPTWPEMEKKVSFLNLQKQWKGIRIDTEALERGLYGLRKLRFDAEQLIPWEWETTPLSLTEMRKACREANIEVPASFAMADEDASKWFAAHGDKFPWINAVRDWRRINMLEKKLETLKLSIRPDGTAPYSLKYFGAGPGRFSGDGKFNIQNLPRKTLYGVDLRGLLLPDAGQEWAIADLAQIEARLTVWAAKDEKTLGLIRQGMSVYEAHARATMGWTGGKLKDENPELYALAKARVLGLGYGCGASKFRTLAYTLARVNLSDAEAAAVVQDYRASNPGVVSLWERLHRWAMYAALEKAPVFEVALPSGRKLSYFEPTMQSEPGYNGQPRQVLYARSAMQAPLRRIFGGLLTENYIQATARDVMVAQWLEAEAKGHDVRFTVHDEFVASSGKAKEALAGMLDIIRTPIPWLPGCPIDGEGHVTDRYCK